MLPPETECYQYNPDYPDQREPLTFERFVSDNSDWFGNEDYCLISKALLENGKYLGGGGAMPEFVLALKNHRAVAAGMIEAMGNKGEQRRKSSADPSIRGLRPSGVEWLLPDEFELYEAAQVGYAKTREPLSEIQRRVKIKRLRRRYGLPEKK